MVNNNKIINISLIIVVLSILVYMIKILKGIFIPLSFAVFLQFMFIPVYRGLEKRRVPGWVINVLLVIFMLGVFFGLGSVVFASVNSFIKEFPKYEVKIQEVFQSAIVHFEIPMEEVRSYINNRVNWVEIFDRLSLSKVIASSMGTFLDFITKLLLTTIFLLFLLAERKSLNERLRVVLSERDIKRKRDTMQDIENSIKEYIINKTIISLITGMISVLWLSIFGVDFAVIAGLLIFILNYIPNFGSIVATAFPIMVCFFQYGIGWVLVVVAGLLIITQVIMGNIIEPRFMGNRLKMSPLVILISLIFWYWVWGPIGMVLAVPIMSAINIILKQFDSMKLFTALIATEQRHPRAPANEEDK
ncbi:MAG: AI-2E family transporter [Candidatus Cloacimonetes bacterium]|nr:AI-2E family transporter [Candidatus Cloacimonadota bacterium]